MKGVLLADTEGWQLRGRPRSDLRRLQNGSLPSCDHTEVTGFPATSGTVPTDPSQAGEPLPFPELAFPVVPREDPPRDQTPPGLLSLLPPGHLRAAQPPNGVHWPGGSGGPRLPSCCQSNRGVSPDEPASRCPWQMASLWSFKGPCHGAADAGMTCELTRAPGALEGGWGRAGRETPALLPFLPFQSKHLCGKPPGPSGGLCKKPLGGADDGGA